MEYTLPSEKYGTQWIKLLDTADEQGITEDGPIYETGDIIAVEGLSVVLLRQPAHSDQQQT